MERPANFVWNRCPLDGWERWRAARPANDLLAGLAAWQRWRKSILTILFGIDDWHLKRPVNDLLADLAAWQRWRVECSENSPWTQLSLFHDSVCSSPPAGCFNLKRLRRQRLIGGLGVALEA